MKRLTSKINKKQSKYKYKCVEVRIKGKGFSKAVLL